MDLLPHQILLVHDLVGQSPRRLLIADEVGLGKTIETGMLIRELIARGDAGRILIVAPAGLTENWRSELESCFRHSRSAKWMGKVTRGRTSAARSSGPLGSRPDYQEL